MKILRFQILYILFACYLNSFSQNTYELFDISSNDNVKVEVNSNNGYKSVHLEIYNKSNESILVDVPCGTYFQNRRSNEQNLVVLYEEKLSLDKRSRKSVNLVTACMDADKSSPSSHSEWNIQNDRALGDLIRFYHGNKAIVSMMTNPKFHETKQQQTDFLQMSVWAYFDAEKKHILNFATKYMFDGNREEAEFFVDSTLPLIQLFTTYYKNMNK